MWHSAGHRESSRDCLVARHQPPGACGLCPQGEQGGLQLPGQRSCGSPPPLGGRWPWSWGLAAVSRWLRCPRPGSQSAELDVCPSTRRACWGRCQGQASSFRSSWFPVFRAQLRVSVPLGVKGVVVGRRIPSRVLGATARWLLMLIGRKSWGLPPLALLNLHAEGFPRSFLVARAGLLHLTFCKTERSPPAGPSRKGGWGAARIPSAPSGLPVSMITGCEELAEVPGVSQEGPDLL